MQIVTTGGLYSTIPDSERIVTHTLSTEENFVSNDVSTLKNMDGLVWTRKLGPVFFIRRAGVLKKETPIDQIHGVVESGIQGNLWCKYVMNGVKSSIECWVLIFFVS